MHKLLVLGHILGVAVYIGASVLVAAGLGPLASGEGDAAGRRARCAALLRVYNPLAIAALGVMVMTGAWALTDYKAGLGAGYFAELGGLMARKLALAFVLVLGAVGACMGIAHRIVREADLEDPADDAILYDRLGRLRIILVAMTILAGYIVWIAMGIPELGAGG